MPDDSHDCDEADIDLATLGMSEGDIIILDFLLYEGSSHSACVHSYTIKACSDEPTSTVALNFNFKVSGIQATGFNNYHEAFAALNN